MLSSRLYPHITYPFFLDTIAAGLVPPFSPFFLAILEHY
jgi:hypothetical protein